MHISAVHTYKDVCLITCRGSCDPNCLFEGCDTSTRDEFQGLRAKPQQHGDVARGIFSLDPGESVGDSDECWLQIKSRGQSRTTEATEPPTSLTVICSKFLTMVPCEEYVWRRLAAPKYWSNGLEGTSKPL